VIAAAPIRDIRERGHALRFGIVTPQMWRSWDELLDIWTRAERAGYDVAFVIDHLQSDWNGDAGPMLEAWTLLAGLAREVPRLQVGTYVSGITYRHPAVLAKQAVSVDHVSGGRLVLGLGAASNAREHAAYGIPFPTIGDRVGLVGDTLEAFRLLETQARTSFEGRHLALHDAPFEPKPVRGHVPVLIGSTRPRMLRLAARNADLVDLADARPAEVERLAAQVASECAAVGRDPDAVALTHEAIAGADPAAELRERVAALAPLGVSVFLVNVWPRRDPDVVDRTGEAIGALRRRWA
jgi:alkanesulfonate monooxygenase SsuD/methylene tetrahydromethanopterin reductase-like flavin-dependent oxidoreductase (luciferase family)